MVPYWRLGLGALSVLVVYFSTQPIMAAILLAVRRRIGKRYRWVGDIHRYLLVYLSWITMLLLFIVIALYILDLGHGSDIVQFMSYIMAIPLVLATFALRVVITNMVVRHFKWDRASSEYDAKIFVVTEVMKFICFIVIMVEIFYIFFLSNDLAGFLLLDIFLSIEVILIVSGFTMLKNIATGLFLVWAEPFRTGSFCKILHLRGFVEKVSLARTMLRRHDGSLVYIPNGIFADFEQTNGSPADAFQHQVAIQLHPAMPIQSILALRDDLFEALADFCEELPEETRDSIAGFRSLSVAEYASSRASAFRVSNASTAELQERNTKALQIGLNDMYRLMLRMTVIRTLFSSLEAAKTEINLCVLTVFHKHNIRPCGAVVR